MLRKLVLGSGMALAAVAMTVVPALAYSGTPGTSASTSPTTVAAGGTVTFSAHFLGGAGQAVTFSAVGGGAGCTATFNPTSGTTDASGNVATVVTFGSNCGGVLDMTAVAGAQNVTTQVTITAFPAASSLPLGIPVPFAWMAVLLMGLVLVGASLFGFGRRRQSSAVSA
jgi:hypothetical protein